MVDILFLCHGVFKRVVFVNASTLSRVAYTYECGILREYTNWIVVFVLTCFLNY